MDGERDARLLSRFIHEMQKIPQVLDHVKNDIDMIEFVSFMSSCDERI